MGLNGYGPPTYDERYPMYSHKLSVVGERVCFSPAITGGYGSQPQGGSCGKVHQTNLRITMDGITTTVHRAGYCSRSGDSGGPVYSGDAAARGIHRGTGSGSVCSDNKYYTPMNVIIDRYNQINNGVVLY